MNETGFDNVNTERQEDAGLSERAKVLGKWLWVLFWLFVPGIIAGFMKNESLQVSAPSVYTAGIVLNIVCGAAYAFVLLKLSNVDDEYHTAGIFELIGVAAALVMLIFPSLSKDMTISFLVAVPTAVISLLGEYHEFSAHSIVLVRVNPDLSDKWKMLWKWLLGCQLATLGCAFVAVISPQLGMAVLFLTAIATVVVYVMKLIYLYRTAKIFRTYPGEGVLA